MDSKGSADPWDDSIGTVVVVESFKGAIVGGSTFEFTVRS
jgi:hypothetical protein